MPATPLVPSSSPSPSSTPANAPSSAVIPITISVIAVVLLVSLMFITLHFRRKNNKSISAAQARKGREAQPGETVSRPHPAALMITPAEGKGTPRFVHTPGTNMRIATRRPDGAWEFADPRAPFTPAIIADSADALPARNSARDHSPSRAHNSPYSHAGYDAVPGSSSELLPPSSATSASPWGAPTTPRTADSDVPGRTPWRAVHSPTPSTTAPTFLSAGSISGSSRRSSAVSSNDSFLDLEPAGSNPFLSPKPNMAPSRGARSPASPLRSPAASTPEPPAPRAPAAESRAVPETRRRDESASGSTTYPGQSDHLRCPPVSPDAPMTPAAFAKEAESRAAREIRRGYERVDRHSEYAEQDEGLPSY
ncbi:hypothetical protein DFH07DRAFT_343973 [Mycena maculata]|uniref:Uncharacterized protein n=1 Tax=Mycena maculata TaxID=230809 RepID=A0AAD7JN77_9AGAR|nr:hypothetical protein DFH07DRAFT_343973 [Mycena maculata]